MRIWSIFALTVLAEFFIQPAEAERNNPLDQIHSIGIVSAIGDQIQAKFIGVTIFANSEEEFSPDWGLDAYVEQKIAATLSGRFVIKPIKAGSKALLLKRPVLLSSGDADLEAYVKSLPPDNGVDAYVIVRKRLVSDPFDHTNQLLWGVGVYHHARLGGDPHAVLGNLSPGLSGHAADAAFPGQTAATIPGFGHEAPAENGLNGVYALYSVLLVDAASGQVLRSGVAGKPGTGIFHTDPPWTQIQSADWPPHAVDATADQQRAVKSALRYVISESLPVALDGCGLSAH